MNAAQRSLCDQKQDYVKLMTLNVLNIIFNSQIKLMMSFFFFSSLTGPVPYVVEMRPIILIIQIKCVQTRRKNLVCWMKV